MQIAVAIPCFKVKTHILDVIKKIGPEVAFIYAVDDACPDGSGQFIEANCLDTRVRVLYHGRNLGVGGAVITAYQAALSEKTVIDVVVKIDGDGQMDPRLLRKFVRPIATGRADYTKGNRFYHPESARGMPSMRLLGNALLSFITKISCGYWHVMDPTNGYTAIHTAVLRELPLDKLEQRYFFETDMLFRLNTIRAVVRDIPMDAVYAGEESNLRVSRVLPEFIAKHISRLCRRYVYNYLVRDFNIGTIYSLAGSFLLLTGGVFGILRWLNSLASNHPASSGTVMMAAMPVLIGIQLLIAFLQYDVSSVPTDPLSHELIESEIT